MSITRKNDKRADDSSQAGGKAAGGRSSAYDPGETSNLVVTASAVGDDTDVLRSVLDSLELGQAEVDTVLHQLGAEFFSEEKGWRRLFERLMDDPLGSARFKRRALADYLDWLERDRGPEWAARKALSEQIGATGFGDRLVRIERGVPTTLGFSGLERIECRLGQCVLWISPGSPPTLAITGQRSVPLEVGKTRIGRASSNEVVLGERWDDVSRHHLVVEVTRSRDIVLTDLSSHGTLVTKAAV